MTYNSYFAKSQDPDAFARALAALGPRGSRPRIAVIGPTQGRAAQEVDDGEGGTVEIPAAGDPDYWYVSLRTKAELDTDQIIAAEPAIQVCDQAEAEAVLGVWA